MRPVWWMCFQKEGHICSVSTFWALNGKCKTQPMLEKSWWTRSSRGPKHPPGLSGNPGLLLLTTHPEKMMPPHLNTMGQHKPYWSGTARSVPSVGVINIYKRHSVLSYGLASRHQRNNTAADGKLNYHFYCSFQPGALNDLSIIN